MCKDHGGRQMIEDIIIRLSVSTFHTFSEQTLPISNYISGNSSIKNTVK